MLLNESQRRQQAQIIAAARREREERERVEVEEQAERKSRNDAARGRYLAKLDAERAARRAADETKLEAEISPERERAMREWLANHPGKSEKDFLAVAWSHLRLNIIEERDRRQVEATKSALLSTGKYSF
jgi:multidrug efflux pump subunit AcrA (membrane-fusion protein)